MSDTKDNENKELAIVPAETTPAALLQLAIQKDLDITKLEKLMELQERWQAGIARKDFLTAISKFQLQCPQLKKSKEVVVRTKDGGSYKYKYSPLGDIDDQIKKPLNENSLSKRWEIKDEGDQILVACIISHANGHSERTEMRGPKDSSGSKNAIQASGSTVTYLQRYSLIAALGLSTADEDIEGAQPPIQKKNQPKPEPKNEGPVVEIPDVWKKKAAACKTPADVDLVIEKNKETVNRHKPLKDFLLKRKDELSGSSIVDGPAHQLDEIPELNAEKGGKPVITNEQFKSSIKLIEGGDLQEYYRVLADYLMDRNQTTAMKNAYTIAKDKKNQK